MTEQIANHLCSDRWSWSSLLYFPLGALLLLLRLPLLVVMACVWVLLPDSWVKFYLVTVFTPMLGLKLEVNRDIKNSPKIFICSKSSIFDYITMRLSFAVEFMGISCQHKTIPPGKCREAFKEHSLSAIKSMQSDSSFYLFIQPQGYISTCQSAIAPASSGDLEGIMQAQILVSETSRPINIACSVGTNTGYKDLLWTLFCPMTTVRIRFVEIMDRLIGETNEEFALRIQKCWADFSELPVLEETEEQAKEALSKKAVKVVDLSQINEKSNEFYSKLTTTDRITLRAQKVNEMIQEERSKYFKRKNLY